MAFGPNSTNPRERRAYAHAKIASARESGERRDLWAAQMAVNGAGDFKKSRGSGFKGAIEGAAMADESTRIIVERAREVIDPELTPRGRVRMGGRELVYAGRLSTDFSAWSRGAYMHWAMPAEETGTYEPPRLTISVHGEVGYPAPRVIPVTQEGEPDVWQIRHIPDEARTALASVAATIAVPRFPGDPVQF